MSLLKKDLSISILVAYTSKNRVIGSQGKIPWNLSSERTRFKKICKNKYIIMGRKSFDEIGHALSYCTIVIISKKFKKAPENCLCFNNLKKAIKNIYSMEKEKGSDDVEILICGGESIYKQALPYASKIYATEIKKEYCGDRFFPALNDEWKKELVAECRENGIDYDYLTFTKG